MSEPNILHIRETIRQARRIENQTHALDFYLRTQLPHLHPIIDLPASNAHRVLLEFVTDYVEQVPDLLEAFQVLMEEAGMGGQSRLLAAIAYAFFEAPPKIVHDHAGLRALVDEAYLAHRLIEEVSDCVRRLCGMPLLPSDMMIPNLVVHELLGDDFATELDLAVQHTLKQVLPSLRSGNRNLRPNLAAFVRARQKRGWDEALARWPCLVDECPIGLRLTGSADIPAPH